MNTDPATMAGPSPSQLRILLFFTVAAPALTVSWGFEAGRPVFVLYREPKLIAFAVLGWVLVSVFLWSFRRDLSFSEVRAALVRPPVLLLAAFLAWLATTGFWVRVPQNYLYELNQYLLLFCLLVMLLVWNNRAPEVAKMVRGGMVASIAVVAVAGLIQWAAPLSFLEPINPDIGAPHPSFMGYKNPAALAVLGQVFLLANLVVTANRRRTRILLGALLAAELVYLVSLGSRTSVAALIAAVFFSLLLWWIRVPSLRRAARPAVVAGLLLALIGGTLAFHPPSRERVASLGSYAAHPSTFLDSDRGTYLLNTLTMVRHNPLGVGLGDWQTHYPLYRSHDPERSFSAGFQVRRAHSDHVQFLGEAGWPGLALWGAFLFTLVWTTAREHLKTGGWEPFFLSGQIVAFAAAMATDYVIELPYNKAQFVFVVFLALAAGRYDPPVRAAKHSRIITAAAVALSVISVGQIVLHAGLARKLHLAAHLERSYFDSRKASSNDRAELERLLFAESYHLGTRFASVFGHTKTFHKDWLIFADCAEQLGRREVALAAARKALALHPHYSPAYLLISRLVSDPESTQQWMRAYEQLMEGPTHPANGRSPLDQSSQVP